MQALRSAPSSYRCSWATSARVHFSFFAGRRAVLRPSASTAREGWPPATAVRGRVMRGAVVRRIWSCSAASTPPARTACWPPRLWRAWGQNGGRLGNAAACCSISGIAAPNAPPPADGMPNGGRAAHPAQRCAGCRTAVRSQHSRPRCDANGVVAMFPPWALPGEGFPCM